MSLFPSVFVVESSVEEVSLPSRFLKYRRILMSLEMPLFNLSSSKTCSVVESDSRACNTLSLRDNCSKRSVTVIRALAVAPAAATRIESEPVLLPWSMARAEPSDCVAVSLEINDRLDDESFPLVKKIKA